MSDIKKCYHVVDRELSSRQAKTLQRVFRNPIVADLEWREVEALIKALGGVVKERTGSRKRVCLGDVRAVFHEPHPRKELDKGAVRSVRDFLEKSGLVKPSEI